MDVQVYVTSLEAAPAMAVHAVQTFGSSPHVPSAQVASASEKHAARHNIVASSELPLMFSFSLFSFFFLIFFFLSVICCCWLIFAEAKSDFFKFVTAFFAAVDFCFC